MTETNHRPTSRVLDILELLAFSPDGYTLTEIANAINAPKSSIFPVVHTLLERNFIAFNNQTSKYVIGISSFAVGSSYIENIDSLDFVKKEMEHIVDVSSETCQMAVLDKGEVLYLAKIDSPEPIRLISAVGKRLPAYCTALGKALLCNFSKEELKKLYPQGLKPYTKNTITDIDVLYHQLCNIKKTNIATEFGESTEHVECLAVPICQGDKIIFSISVSIPVFRVTEEKNKLIERLLLQSKTKIETLINSLDIDMNSIIFN